LLKNFLQFLKKEVLFKINKTLGKKTIKDIRIVRLKR